jgi:hypothetical protein
MPSPFSPEEDAESAPRYSKDDFCDDLQRLFELVGGTARPSFLIQAQQDHFESKYPDPDENLWRKRRCVAALNYWIKHRGSLGVIRAKGSDAELVVLSGPVKLALWTVWSNEKLEPENLSPPIDVFVKLCWHYASSTYGTI